MTGSMNTRLPGGPHSPARDGRSPDHSTTTAQPGPRTMPQDDRIPPAIPTARGWPRPANPAPYGHGKRLFYGLLWSGWTLLLGLGGLFALPHGKTFLGGLLALALAALTGRYAYRIWTWQAKRLIFFIIW